MITSQVQNGPSSAAVEAIRCAFEELGNEEVAAMAVALARIEDDGTRSGLVGIDCVESCLVNKNALDGTCPEEGYECHQ